MNGIKAGEAFAKFVPKNDRGVAAAIQRLERFGDAVRLMGITNEDARTIFAIVEAEQKSSTLLN